MKLSIQILTIAFVILTVFGELAAQETDEYSKWEFYGGYSTLRTQKTQVEGDNTSVSAGVKTERPGFSVSATRNLNRYFGLKFDFSRNSMSFNQIVSLNGDLEVKNKFSTQLYSAGVQVKDNAAPSKIKPFAHLLIGGMVGRGETRVINCPPGSPVCGEESKGSRFAVTLGGGFDVKINSRMSVRPLQIDLVHVNNAIPKIVEKNNIRMGAGVVFHVDRIEIPTNTSNRKFPKYEIHAGYIFNKSKQFDIGPSVSLKFNGLQGYNASFKWNFHRFLGAEFEQSSGWNKSQHIVSFVDATIQQALHTYTGGIQVKDNSTKTRFKPFGHALFGAATAVAKLKIQVSGTTLPLNANTPTFVAIYGGGLDIKMSDKFSLRPFQFDYINPSKRVVSTNYLDNSYRFGAGIVFH